MKIIERTIIDLDVMEGFNKNKIRVIDDKGEEIYTDIKKDQFEYILPEGLKRENIIKVLIE